MRPAALTCPYAKYGTDMYIRCTKRDDLCTHQRWCTGVGWCVLTDGATGCKARVEESETTKPHPKKKRGSKSK